MQWLFGIYQLLDVAISMFAKSRTPIYQMFCLAKPHGPTGVIV